MRARLKLAVEGWRSLSHSYAVVNQWQLLSLARRQDIALRVRDLAFSNPYWREQPGLFCESDAFVLREIEKVQPDFSPDATWRLGFPYDLRPAPTGRTLVFGTAEYRLVPKSFLAGRSMLEAAVADPSVSITTPSHWSAEGFRRLGFEDSRIAVIPHGIDPSLFRPRPEVRAEMRRQLGVSGFVFMSVGAMSGNKGMDALLKAFAAVAERRGDVWLVLKGSDHLYRSRQLLQQTLNALTRAEADRIVRRLVYGGASLSMSKMSALYQAADAYVSPYRAEGFNLPVLEAAACGVPIICTSGGATDDFTAESFAWRIDSRLRNVRMEGEVGDFLEPTVEHLIDLLDRVVDDDAFRTGAAIDGPRHATEHFAWDRVTERAMTILSSQLN
jgi:glycosyltransferase involved in cell wall biosynthesis